MKKFLFIVALMLCCAMTMFAQNNNKISYQAVVRDTENKLVANKNVNVTVTITDADNHSYTQEFTDVQTNFNGMLSLMIGPDGENADWNNIHWNHANVVTTVTLAGVELGTLTMPLTAVPYALYAKEISPDGTVVTNIYNKMQQDSADLAEKMRADSLLLHGALVDSAGNIRGALTDSVRNIDSRMNVMATTLHNKITTLDNKVTTRMNTISDSVKTTLDSVTNVSTTLHNEITAVSTDMQTNYAKLAGDNTFSGDNNFTGPVTASSVTVTCGENVTADVCDLLQRINTLEQKINDPQTLLDLVGQMNDEQKRTLKNALGIYVADSVTLNKHTTTITTGGSEVLVAKVWPSEAAQEVQWSSSNPSVATVNNDGVVYAVTTGQTVITAKSMSEPSYYATCTVTVSNPQPNALFNLKRNDDGSWEVTMPTNDLEVEIEVYNE